MNFNQVEIIGNGPSEKLEIKTEDNNITPSINDISIPRITEELSQAWTGDGAHSLKTSLSKSIRIIEDEKPITSYPDNTEVEVGFTTYNSLQEGFPFQTSNSIGLSSFNNFCFNAQPDISTSTNVPLTNSFAFPNSTTKRNADTDNGTFHEKEMDIRSSTAKQVDFNFSIPLNASITDYNLNDIPDSIDHSLQELPQQPSHQLPVFPYSYVSKTTKESSLPLPSVANVSLIPEHPEGVLPPQPFYSGASMKDTIRGSVSAPATQNTSYSLQIKESIVLPISSSNAEDSMKQSVSIPSGQSSQVQQQQQQQLLNIAFPHAPSYLPQQQPQHNSPSPSYPPPPQQQPSSYPSQQPQHNSPHTYPQQQPQHNSPHTYPQQQPQQYSPHTYPQQQPQHNSPHTYPQQQPQQYSPHTYPQQQPQHNSTHTYPQQQPQQYSPHTYPQQQPHLNIAIPHQQVSMGYQQQQPVYSQGAPSYPVYMPQQSQPQQQTQPFPVYTQQPSSPHHLTSLQYPSYIQQPSSPHQSNISIPNASFFSSNDMSSFSQPSLPFAPDIIPPQPIFSSSQEHIPPHPVILHSNPSSTHQDSFYNPSGLNSITSQQSYNAIDYSYNSLQSLSSYGPHEQTLVEPYFSPNQQAMSSTSAYVPDSPHSFASASPQSYYSGSPGSGSGSPGSICSVSSLSSPRGRNIHEGKKKKKIVAELSTGQKIESIVVDMKTPKKIKKWTPEEDELLLEGVRIEGIPNWAAIAKHVPGRNNTQCCQRYNKVIKPGIKKGSWSKEEDAMLIELVQRFGENNWEEVAKYIPGRHAQKCKERYMHYIGPHCKKGNWTVEEDNLILELQKQWGNSWAAIAQQLPGRPANDVRTRFKTLTNNKRKQANGVY